MLGPLLLMMLFMAPVGDSTAQMEIEAHTSTAEEELQALLGFRRSADRRELLSTWSGGFSPCNRGEDNGSWVGVECYKGHVFKLVLEDFHLEGGIEPLLGLRSLRVLSLKNNALNGSLPRNLSNWRNLKFLYLGGNRLDGELPTSLALLTHLWRLDLSRNLLSGPIPDSINALDSLLTLRLEDNGFSGSLPALQNLTMLVDFNVSDNRLRGVIPKTLQRRFNSSTFLGNVDLCGLPLSRRCNQSRDFHIPAPSPSSINQHQDTPAAASPFSATSSGTHGAASKSKSNKLSTGAIIAIVVGDTVVLVVMTLLFLIYYWNKYYSRTGSSSSSRALIHLDSNPKNTATAPKIVEHDDHFYSRSSGASSISIVPASNKLVFVDHRFRSFDLEDLLRASAEMLGKGSLGSAYKAVLEDGFVVAVKRLKDVTSSSRKEFEQHMDLIARMKSPNLVHLRAFYYAKDEKLLVYDFMPNGSLHTLLHGNRGPGRVPVDWTTRLKIALGAAKGLAHIHQESGSHKIPHGNIKSSNVLLDKNGVACVGDFGLALLMNTVACSRLVGYRAPEHSETRRISQKGDVYSFGVLLLEILTGKSPVQSEGGGTTDLARWVQSVVREEWTAEVFDLELMRYKNIEEEMVTLLQIAMSCVAQSPDARPKMSQVVKLIEEIRGDISPGRDESFDSQSQSSYLSEDAPTSQ